MSERFPRVTVQSGRPDSTGRPRFGEHGEGVILDDDLDTVYITADGWYGEWPVTETDIVSIRQAREAERKSREDHTIGDDTTAELNAYEYLLRQLQQQGLKVAEKDGEVKAKTVALIDKRGNYLRLPSIDEFRMDFDTLQKEGLVE